MALIAGADQATAARLGVAMVALQASIGALNDLVDAPTDASRKPGKPIPTGLVSVGVARAVVAIGAALGLLLAAPSGPVVVALAVAGLGIGYGYDLRAKGTPWSWLPFALGIPLLPVFGWFGAAGRLPSAFALLVPAAMAAGAALAIANARADLERDAAAGLESVAIRLGSDRAWVVQAALLAVVVLVVLGSLWLRGAPPLAVVGTVSATLLIAGGLVLGRRGAPDRRQQAWEIEAVGVALLAVAWLAGFGDLR
ncbi:MAG: UbiA family prenyltransferase [Candidatus Limnocylindrales bacterium]|nr:UbiA family prenyltransferase [Candidatus Limnocylindrales bacterium]